VIDRSVDIVVDQGCRLFARKFIVSSELCMLMIRSNNFTKIPFWLIFYSIFVPLFFWKTNELQSLIKVVLAWFLTIWSGYPDLLQVHCMCNSVGFSYFGNIMHNTLVLIDSNIWYSLLLISEDRDRSWLWWGVWRIRFWSKWCSRSLKSHWDAHHTIRSRSVYPFMRIVWSISLFLLHAFHLWFSYTGILGTSDLLL
jgi:hypothetical protein